MEYKEIAIITGATGGMGRKFVELLLQEKGVNELWCIARNENRLHHLQQKCPERIRLFSLDLSKKDSFDILSSTLEKENVSVRYLINNASRAKMAKSSDFTLEELDDTIDLNCKSMVKMIQIALPFMKKGSHIITMSSQSAFQPVAYLNLYASTKAFERNYSRALNKELKSQGIVATCVCPGWVDTEMLYQEYNGQKTKFKHLVSSKKVAQRAIKDAKKGKEMSICTLYVKWMHLCAKFFPTTWVMKTWLFSIRKYIKNERN